MKVLTILVTSKNSKNWCIVERSNKELAVIQAVIHFFIFRTNMTNMIIYENRFFDFFEDHVMDNWLECASYWT